MRHVFPRSRSRRRLKRLAVRRKSKRVKIRDDQALSLGSPSPIYANRVDIIMLRAVRQMKPIRSSDHLSAFRSINNPIKRVTGCVNNLTANKIVGLVQREQLGAFSPMRVIMRLKSISKSHGHDFTRFSKIFVYKVDKYIAQCAEQSLKRKSNFKSNVIRYD